MKDWFKEYIEWEARARKAEEMLKKFAEGNDLRRAEHMHFLEEKNKKLKQELTRAREIIEERNKTLYATGLIVNCTGCETGKPFKGEELTDEKITEIENLAYRLRTWHKGHLSRTNPELYYKKYSSLKISKLQKFKNWFKYGTIYNRTN